MSNPSRARELPHSYPFRLIDVGTGEAVIVCLTQTGRLDACGLSIAHATEMMAQAAAILLAHPAEEQTAPGRIALAGIQNAVLHERIGPGTRLRAKAETLGRFGAMTKARIALTPLDGDPDRTVAECELLLSRSN